jgi:hypothetical protein
MKIESLDVLKAQEQLDLQEHTRMKDVYRDIEDIIERISNLPLGLPLVWVYAWDVARDLFTSIQEGQEEEYCVTEDIEDVWEMFWVDAGKNGFSLEYGPEALYDHIRDWMTDRQIIDEVPEEDDEDEDE